jgi:hypothetical protein
MGIHRSPVTVGGSVTLAALVVACGGTTSPTPTSTSLVGVPNNNALIPQNDPATGCALLAGADATRGLGFQIQYRWAAASPTSGIAGYELLVTKANASLPFIDTIVATTDYTDTECNAFVADVNRQGWQWRVRAKDAQGQFSDWSGWFTFQFSPCRLSDGTPCRDPK